MIGIISAPNNINNFDCAHSYLYASYKYWVEMSGEHCIIIPYDIEEKKLNILLKRVSGLIWVGGGMPDKKYHTQQQEDDLLNTLFCCYNYAVKENDKGNYYPIWGTCLGMDILIMFSKNESFTIKSSLSTFPLNGNYPLTFVDGSSRIKKSFPPHLQELMKTHKCVNHQHMFGNDTVPDTIKIVSMQYNFINCIEFVHYPFYGVQFHPERPPTDLGIKVSQTLIDFFADECKKNKNVWKWKLSDFKKQKILI
jgi:gamma-glutamyl hydrolase